MSKISTIYDHIETKINTVLPAYNELSNPYFPETNADLGYDKGYGLAIAAGVNLLKNEKSKKETKQQDFIISLTRRIFGTKKDTATRKSVEKSLMEDQRLITNEFAKDIYLGLACDIILARYISHDGIEFVRVGRQDIIIIRSLVQIEYHEMTV